MAMMKRYAFARGTKSETERSTSFHLTRALTITTFTFGFLVLLVLLALLFSVTALFISCKGLSTFSFWKSLDRSAIISIQGLVEKLRPLLFFVVSKNKIERYQLKLKHAE